MLVVDDSRLAADCPTFRASVSSAWERGVGYPVFGSVGATSTQVTRTMVKARDLTVDRSNDSEDNTEETENTGNTTSTSHTYLFIADEPPLSDEVITGSSDPEAYDLMKDGGDVRDAFQGTDSDGNEWTHNDVLSHAIVGYDDLVQAGYKDPRSLAKAAQFFGYATNISETASRVGPHDFVPFDNLDGMMEALTNAFCSHLEGNTGRALELFEPTGDDIADYVAQSDDVEAEDVTAALSDESADD